MEVEARGLDCQFHDQLVRLQAIYNHPMPPVMRENDQRSIEATFIIFWKPSHFLIMMDHFKP